MKQIQIYEVGPRDGFQNVTPFIPTETKAEIIDDLISSGIKHLQLTSYVSPKAVPQMSDAKELTELCVKQHPEIDYLALIPNLTGAKIAWELGIKTVSYVVSLSKTHNKANINRTHEESLDEFLKIRTEYPNLDVCLDLATAFGCPFEGKYINSEAVDFVESFVQHGIKILNLCDTIGMADPGQVRILLDGVRNRYPDLQLMVHIHDTRNMGMVNTLAAIELGVNRVQSTIGGLGGCPFAPGASGNLATEDLVYMLNAMGYETGINFEKLKGGAMKVKEKIPDGVFSGHHINVVSGFKSKAVENLN